MATEPFLDEALEQARLLGMPDYRMVYVPHPVQLLTLDELHAQADAVFEQIVGRRCRRRAPHRARAVRYVALLRGINVGGKTLIKMADLRACFEQLGFDDVSTYIASGNVLFETGGDGEAGSPTTIEAAIERAASSSR